MRMYGDAYYLSVLEWRHWGANINCNLSGYLIMDDLVS